MNKKGFTLVELLGVIILIGILALVTISISNSIVEENRQDIYVSHEKTMTRSASQYVLTKDLILPTEPGDTVTIALSTLQDEGFIEAIKDSGGDEDCTGYVEIVIDANGILSYNPFLSCGSNYQTP